MQSGKLKSNLFKALPKFDKTQRPDGENETDARHAQILLGTLRENVIMATTDVVGSD